MTSCKSSLGSRPYTSLSARSPKPCPPCAQAPAQQIKTERQDSILLPFPTHSCSLGSFSSQKLCIKILRCIGKTWARRDASPGTHLSRVFWVFWVEKANNRLYSKVAPLTTNAAFDSPEYFPHRRRLLPRDFPAKVNPPQKGSSFGAASRAPPPSPVGTHHPQGRSSSRGRAPADSPEPGSRIRSRPAQPGPIPSPLGRLSAGRAEPPAANAGGRRSACAGPAVRPVPLLRRRDMWSRYRAAGGLLSRGR